LKSSGMPRAVGDLLPDALPQLVERLAEVRVHQAWETVVGPDVARRTRPGSLVEGCLTVIVDNSPWLHELSLRQPELLAMIRLRCPSVRTLRLTVGALPPDAREGGIVVAPAMPLSERDQREIEEATAIIPDAALAAAARRLLTQVRRAEGRSELPS
jgi:hypothetical protein